MLVIINNRQINKQFNLINIIKKNYIIKPNIFNKLINTKIINKFSYINYLYSLIRKLKNNQKRNRLIYIIKNKKNKLNLFLSNKKYNIYNNNNTLILKNNYKKNKINYKKKINLTKHLILFHNLLRYRKKLIFFILKKCLRIKKKWFKKKRLNYNKKIGRLIFHTFKKIKTITYFKKKKYRNKNYKIYFKKKKNKIINISSYRKKKKDLKFFKFYWKKLYRFILKNKNTNNINFFFSFYRYSIEIKKNILNELINKDTYRKIKKKINNNFFYKKKLYKYRLKKNIYYKMIKQVNIDSKKNVNNITKQKNIFKLININIKKKKKNIYVKKNINIKNKKLPTNKYFLICRLLSKYKFVINNRNKYILLINRIKHTLNKLNNKYYVKSNLNIKKDNNKYNYFFYTEIINKFQIYLLQYTAIKKYNNVLLNYENQINQLYSKNKKNIYGNIINVHILMYNKLYKYYNNKILNDYLNFYKSIKTMYKNEILNKKIKGIHYNRYKLKPKYNFIKKRYRKSKFINKRKIKKIKNKYIKIKYNTIYNYNQKIIPIHIYTHITTKNMRYIILNNRYKILKSMSLGALKIERKNMRIKKYKLKIADLFFKDIVFILSSYKKKNKKKFNQLIFHVLRYKKYSYILFKKIKKFIRKKIRKFEKKKIRFLNKKFIRCKNKIKNKKINRL